MNNRGTVTSDFIDCWSSPLPLPATQKILSLPEVVGGRDVLVSFLVIVTYQSQGGGTDFGP